MTEQPHAAERDGRHGSWFAFWWLVVVVAALDAVAWIALIADPALFTFYLPLGVPRYSELPGITAVGLAVLLMVLLATRLAFGWRTAQDDVDVWWDSRRRRTRGR